MKYREIVKIRPECEGCPWLESCANQHDMAEDAKVELSEAVMDGQVTQGLFAMLIEEGYSIEEAEAFIAEKAGDVHTLNVEALEDLDAHQETMISVGGKLMKSCESGVYIDSDDPQLVVCMSGLAAAISASLRD